MKRREGVGDGGITPREGTANGAHHTLYWVRRYLPRPHDRPRSLAASYPDRPSSTPAKLPGHGWLRNGSQELVGGETVFTTTTWNVEF